MGKGKSIISLGLVVVIIAALAFTAVNGLQVGSYLFPSVFDEKHGIRKGLDLVGGSVITYEAQVGGNMGGAELAENMDVVEQMLRQRLNDLGYFEATIVRVGEKRVTIEIPSIADPEEAVQKIGSTAKVEFKDADGNVILDGNQVADARAAYGPISQGGLEQYYVSIEFTPEGTQKFSEATGKFYQDKEKNHISILLDGKVLSSPTFDSQLNESRVSISGSFDKEGAMWLGNIIAAGKLPFELKDIELRSVGPSLGERSLETCLYAGAIGVLLVMLFMILVYRLPGLLTSIILVGYIAVVGLILSAFQVNLSLPGIAGIILSVGMAVDANVIIFERINEELKAGKSLKGSIKAGFSRAFSAIIDANITTIIASGVLYYFGTGSIKGFAITLFTGVVVSMFTAIFVTKFMMNAMANLDVKNPKLYGRI